MLCTQIGQLHMQRADRSGGCLYKASNGILPLSEHITIWFVSHVVCLSALPHVILRRLLVCLSACIPSSRVSFSCSTMPFTSSVLCVVNFLPLPTLLRC